jgi:hypothetical protein
MFERQVQQDVETQAEVEDLEESQQREQQKRDRIARQRDMVSSLPGFVGYKVGSGSSYAFSIQYGQDAKDHLLALANAGSLARLPFSKLANSATSVWRQWCDIQSENGSIEKLLEPPEDGCLQKLVQVTTCGRLLDKVTEDPTSIKLLELLSFDTEVQFRDEVTHFLTGKSKKNESQFMTIDEESDSEGVEDVTPLKLVLQCERADQREKLVASAKYSVEECLATLKTRRPIVVVLVLQLSSVVADLSWAVGQSSNSVSWKSIHVEEFEKNLKSRFLSTSC